jgi:serine/threonine protein kinase
MMIEERPQSLFYNTNSNPSDMTADIIWEFDMSTNNFLLHSFKSSRPFTLEGTDYVIERRSIGSKINSPVYMAQDTKSNAIRAVKVAQKKAALTELYNEKIILSTLQGHPNIIRIHDYIETSKQSFLFLEYGGISLRKYLETLGGRMTERKANPILAQMIEAVYFLHQNQISHHDIKLENFVIDSKLTVRLIDFGYSIRYETSLVSHFFGSLAYACAEVLQRQPHSPEKADVYSLGVCFFRMLCGHLPFCDTSLDDARTLLAKVKRGTFVIPHEVFLTEKLKTLLNGMLCSTEANRFDMQMILGVYSGTVR